jgi:hypothetical protein
MDVDLAEIIRKAARLNTPRKAASRLGNTVVQVK